MKQRILVAGIGNIFLGDDAFGVEVAQRLAQRPQPDEVRVVDFGIRGFDLAYELLNDYDASILVDTVQRGGAPGTLYVIEPDLDEHGGVRMAGVPTHNVDPVQVLALVNELGGRPRGMRLVGCEPETFGDELHGHMGLSAPLEAVLDDAVALVESLVADIIHARQPAG